MLYLRKRRNVGLVRLIDSLEAPVRVLDAGGSPLFWESVSNSDKCNVTILNRRQEGKSEIEQARNFRLSRFNDFELRFGDARAMPEIDTDSYDVVVCNSVIEHVGLWEHMEAASREIRRVGKHGWVQIPAFEFPFEVHHCIPFIHWFSAPIRRCMLRVFLKRSISQLRAYVETVNLVTRAEMKALFPGARVFSEWFLLLPKSHIATW